ncbi:MAG: iron-sulfur cluster-binding domain-containing protein [bacterium]
MRTKVHIKGELIDLLAPFYLLPDRKRRFEKALPDPIESDPVNELARAIHPAKLKLEIAEIRRETDSAKTFRFVPAPDSGLTSLPFFRAGQYLSLKVDIDGSPITRPYSISSSPNDTLNNGFYEITIRRKEGGFFTEHIWNSWDAGMIVESSGPCGLFYYDSIRDSKELVGIAGGAGITPFRSMIKDIIENDLDVHFTLLYGTKKADDIIFKDELLELAVKAPYKLSVHFVCSEPDSGWDGLSGFLTSECISNCCGEMDRKTFFICGPQVMYKFLEKEMTCFDIPAKRIRREAFGEIPDITQYHGFPEGAAEKVFEITALIGNESKVLPARATESVVVALERAGIAAPSQCRSGECGFCRSILISGDVFVCPDNDGRRLADKKFSFFHPCSSFPVSDLKIKVIRDI